MKKVILIHRWDGNPKSDWYPWMKRELENRKFKVIVQEMPNTSKPEINSWVSKLSKSVGKLDNNTYFMGHSMGCQTIMRYLEKTKIGGKAGGCVFVAGWFNLANLENEDVKNIAKPWIEDKIDLRKVKEHIGKLTVILSSNEPYGFVEENSKTFKEGLNAKVIIEKNKGHFTEYDGVTTNKTALNELLKMAGVK